MMAALQYWEECDDRGRCLASEFRRLRRVWMRALQGRAEVALLLVQSGTATLARDNRGQTPLDHAAAGGFEAALLAEAAKTKRCAVCGAGGNLKKCSRCKAVSYCGADCQRAHWAVHKRSCRQRE